MIHSENGDVQMSEAERKKIRKEKTKEIRAFCVAR